MYPYNYNMRRNYNNMYRTSNNNDRFIGFGGFAVPFLLGGITGAALTNRPYYYNNYYYYPPYYYPYQPYPYYY